MGLSGVLALILPEVDALDQRWHVYRFQERLPHAEADKSPVLDVQVQVVVIPRGLGGLDVEPGRALQRARVDGRHVIGGLHLSAGQRAVPGGVLQEEVERQLVDVGRAEWGALDGGEWSANIACRVTLTFLFHDTSR